MWNIAHTENCGLPPRLLMFVLSLAFVDPYNNESQFWAGTERDDELSKLAIVLLFNPRIGQLQSR